MAVTARRYDPRVAAGQFISAVDRTLIATPIWIAATTLLLALQAWLVLTHIAWSDEWQALFIAIQSPDLGALLSNLRYEGHPPLWYLLLRAADYVLPWRQILPGVQLLIALSIQLLIFRAPFTRAERLLLGLSYFILFEFGALSRSLSLGALAIIAFFAIKNRFLRWGIIALLPLIDFQFGLLSIVAIILLFHDKDIWWPGMLAWLTTSLFAAWSVRPAADMITSQDGNSMIAAALKFLDDLSALLVPLQTLDGQLGWSGGWPWGLGIAGGVAFLWFVDCQSRTHMLHKWLLRSFIVVTCVFSLTIYSLSIRHLTLIPLLLILFKWREAKDGLPLNGAMQLWLAAAAACGILVTAISATRPFDSAPQVAHYIFAHGLEDKNWLAWRPERGLSLTAQLGKEFSMAQGGCTYSFIRWTFRDNIQDEAHLIQALEPYVSYYGRSYLVTTLQPKSVKSPLLRHLASFPAGYDGYPYHLYMVGPDLRETQRRPRPCNPVRVALPSE